MYTDNGQNTLRITINIFSVYALLCGMLLATNSLAVSVYSSDDVKLKIRGLADFRLAYTDDTLNWLEEGTGKARYGRDERQALLRLSEFSFLADLQLGEAWQIKTHLKADREQKDFVDIAEGFVQYRPTQESVLGFSLRAGAFFPPFSMENRGLAWSSVYTLSASAINSWIGEEFRTLGTEAQFNWQGDGKDIALVAAIFKANDAAGSLLAWRGWAVHDRETGLFDRLALADIPAIAEGGVFADQAQWVEPFHEIDGRFGYYGGLQGNIDKGLQFKYYHYDNQGDPKVFNGTQYAWRTRFDSLGGRWKINAQQEILGQFIDGITRMGFANAMVDNSYRSWYLLFSQLLAKKHRISLRYEDFQVEDHDQVVNDDNSETGDAWTLAWLYYYSRQHRFLLESLYIDSERAARHYLNENSRQREWQLQLNYRLVWN